MAAPPGDFSFYRAYVGKDGKPAAFAADNVPYQPKHFLKFADQPLGADDFVMVAGYRAAPTAMRWPVSSTKPPASPTTIAKHYNAVLKMIADAGKADADVKVKYAATAASMNNVAKNYLGQLEGFKRIDAAGRNRRKRPPCWRG